jgi:hypothetical protein
VRQVVPGRRSLALRITCGDRVQVEPRRGVDERRVERPPGEAIADEPDANRRVGSSFIWTLVGDAYLGQHNPSVDSIGVTLRVGNR